MKQQIMILSGKSNMNYDSSVGQRVAVFIHLHYRDTLDKYLSYVSCIPKEIPTYISSSDKLIENIVHKYAVEQKREITVIHKENRGRDITALLIAFREIMLQYELVCFLHDKKEKHERDKKDVMLWIDNLWGNLLGKEGTEYFSEVLTLFEKDKSLGLLVPPEPIGEIFPPDNGWFEANVSQTRKVAEELDLCSDIDPDIENQPLALGTCFWARTDAIRKILLKNWVYGDFDDEPLPESAKSHGIERIFGYLTEDAGYCARIVMNREYAAVYLGFLIECRRKAFQIIENRYEVSTLLSINRLKKCAEYASKHKIFYIYGAGKVGRRVYRYLKDMGHLPQNFLVSKKERDYNKMSIPVVDMDHLIYEEGMGIIIAVGFQITPIIVDILEKKGIKDYFCMAQN
jgi:rhamnosyltransferase